MLSRGNERTDGPACLPVNEARVPQGTFPLLPVNSFTGSTIGNTSHKGAAPLQELDRAEDRGVFPIVRIVPVC